MGMVTRLRAAFSSFTSASPGIVWLGSAVLSAAVSGLISYPLSYSAAYRAQVDADTIAQSREVLAARATEFSTGDGFLPVIGQYIRAVNEQSKLDEAQVALRDKLAEEISRTQALEVVFGSDIRPAIEHYQEAIQLLVGAIPSAKDPTSMYEWTVYVDQVLTAKSHLSNSLLAQAGLKAPDAA